MSKIIIENGTLPDGNVADIFIENGKIKEILPPAPSGGVADGGSTTLDASGCFVFPGGIDPHTHVNLKIGTVRVKDGWAEATRAAALGGTTCLIEHPSFGSTLDGVKAEAEGKPYIDYGFHSVFEPSTNLSEIPKLVSRGVPSGKVYMTYSGMLDDENFLRVLRAMKNAGGLTCVHAENDAIVRELSKKFRDIAPHSPASHALSRPDYCEAEAVSRAIALARAAGAPLYIVHLSTQKGLDIIRAAKKEGLPVFAETCPQYLLWTDEKYERPDGMDYIMSPPLRKQSDCDALWEGVADGTIDTIGTDHCYFVRTGDDVFGALGGIPGIGERISRIFIHGVLEGKISSARFAELIAGNPAKIFGLKNKGELKEGFDADITIIDKKGGIPHVFLRGTPLVENYQFVGKENFGKFTARGVFQNLA